MTPDVDRSRLELRPPEERLRALRSQRRSAIPRGCLWWSAWCVVGAGIWVAGILIVASVLAAPRSAPGSPFSAPPPAGAGLSAGSGAGSGFGVPAHSGAPLGPLSETVDPVDAVERRPLTLGGTTKAPSPAQPGSDAASAPGYPGSDAAPVPPAVSHGVASWFDARGMQGAVPWWHAGQQPVWATVSRFAGGKTYSVTVLVTGFCACLAGQLGERLIDVSPAAFRALGAPLSVGLLEVTMEVPVQGPRLPATDEEGPE